MDEIRITIEEKRRAGYSNILYFIKSFISLYSKNCKKEVIYDNIEKLCNGRSLKGYKMAGKVVEMWSHDKAFSEVLKYPVNFGFNYFAPPMYLYLDSFEVKEGQLNTDKDKLLLLSLVIDLLIAINDNEPTTKQKSAIENKLNTLSLKNRIPLNTKKNSVDAKKALYLILDLCQDKISLIQFLDSFNPYLVRL